MNKIKPVLGALVIWILIGGGAGLVGGKSRGAVAQTCTTENPTKLSPPRGTQASSAPQAVQAKNPKTASQPERDAAKGKLDDVLEKWEKAVGGIKSLTWSGTQTNKDNVFRSSEVTDITLRFLREKQRGDRLASLEWRSRGKPPRHDLYIYHSRTIYEFDEKAKEVRWPTIPSCCCRR